MRNERHARVCSGDDLGGDRVLDVLIWTKKKPEEFPRGEDVSIRFLTGGDFIPRCERY